MPDVTLAQALRIVGLEVAWPVFGIVRASHSAGPLFRRPEGPTVKGRQGQVFGLTIDGIGDGSGVEDVHRGADSPCADVGIRSRC